MLPKRIESQPKNARRNIEESQFKETRRSGECWKFAPKENQTENLILTLRFISFSPKKVWFQNARAKDKKSRNSRCYTDDDSLHQTSSVASPDLQIDDCKICGVQKVNLQEHVFSREHIAQVKSLLENGGINCLNEQQTFDKSPSVTPTPQSAPQTVAATASIIGGLYNQYLMQQNNQSQQSLPTNNSNSNGAGTPNAGDNDNFHPDDDQNQKNDKDDQQSMLENNLLLQINADKQSSTPPTNNSEILQQLYNYSQMSSGELIKW